MELGHDGHGKNPEIFWEIPDTFQEKLGPANFSRDFLGNSRHVSGNFGPSPQCNCLFEKNMMNCNFHG